MSAKQEAIEAADAELNNAGLPTYTELKRALNELAVYVKNNVSSDAIHASADRANKLLRA